MKKEEIDILLRRYYEGSASDSDEKTLKDLFSRSDIPDGYETEKALFAYFSDVQGIPAPSADFENRIISSVDSFSKAEKPYRKLLFTLSGIAAGVIILIGSWFYLSSKTSDDTFKDPQIAYAETIKILYGVSSQLNSGTAGLETVSMMNLSDVKGIDVLSRSAETIEKNLMSLDYLNKVIGIKDLPVEKNK